jgi:cell division protein ZapA (FtsZ GTPase activity inhibitor)
MLDKLSIKVKIVDRYYPLTIDVREEEKVRRAAKLINEKVLQYKQRYKQKDVIDFLAMSCLQFATKSVESEQNNDITELIGNISKIDEELGNVIKKIH